MPFFVCVPVRFPRMSCTVTAWNDRNTSTFFDPTDKMAAVIASISKDHLSCQLKRLQYFSCQANVIPVSAGKQKVQRITKPIRYRMDLGR